MRFSRTGGMALAISAGTWSMVMPVVDAAGAGASRRGSIPSESGSAPSWRCRWPSSLRIMTAVGSEVVGAGSDPTAVAALTF